MCQHRKLVAKLFSFLFQSLCRNCSLLRSYSKRAAMREHIMTPSVKKSWSFDCKSRPQESLFTVLAPVSALRPRRRTWQTAPESLSNCGQQNTFEHFRTTSMTSAYVRSRLRGSRSRVFCRRVFSAVLKLL